jgi:hypothetical protein
VETSNENNWLMPRHWPQQTDLLTWCRDMNAGNAALLVMFGLVYLFYGFYLYKYLVMANAAWIGGWIGITLGRHGNSALLGCLIGAFIAGALTWPTMKYSVAVMGGLFGAVFGASVWNSVSLDPRFAWAGALSGLIAFGMLSFIIFRGSIMMYKSLQGSVMLIFGLLGLICKYQSVGPTVTYHMKVQPVILPLAILVAMILGIVYQQHNHPAASGGVPVKK